MLSRVARSAARVLPRGEALVAQRSMSLAGMKGYDDREAAEELIFFKKEEERLLRQLLKKVKQSADKHDVHAAKGVVVAERSALEAIVSKYKVSEADIEKLLDWKHHAF